MKEKIGDARKEYGVYYALYLLYTAGMVGAVLATNLIEFFMFYEFMLIPSYFLILQWGYGARERIAFMYFIWTHLGALALLAGILVIYGIVGSLDIYEIPGLLKQANPSFELTLGISVLMFIGFFVKMAVFGLHIWLPHAHAEAPTPISALLSPAMIGIGGYATVRTTMMFFSEVFEAVGTILSIWALVTIVYGGIMALAQDDLKRLLAYSSISQMGYILLGISSYNTLGVSGSIFHYVAHGTCKGLLFMVAGSIILQAGGLRSIKALGGLASRMPITTMAALIGFLGIMGIPPLNGFQSEWMLFSGVFQEAIASGSTLKLVTAYVGIMATILTAVYSLWTLRRVFFGERPDYLEHVKEAPREVTIPLLILSTLTVLLGVFPGAISRVLLPIIATIIGNQI
jgi:NADH-quinone oxidoreductase subunit M